MKMLRRIWGRMVWQPEKPEYYTVTGGTDTQLLVESDQLYEVQPVALDTGIPSFYKPGDRIRVCKPREPTWFGTIWLWCRRTCSRILRSTVFRSRARAQEARRLELLAMMSSVASQNSSGERADTRSG